MIYNKPIYMHSGGLFVDIGSTMMRLLSQECWAVQQSTDV